MSEFELGAYDHMSFGVGWSDEDRASDHPAVVCAKASALPEDDAEQYVFEQNMPERGAWHVWFDFDARYGFVAYEVVVDTEHSVDTVECDVLTREEAIDYLYDLPRKYIEIGREQLLEIGADYTEEERKANAETIEYWRSLLERNLP